MAPPMNHVSFVQGYRASVARQSSDKPVIAEHFQRTVKYLPEMFWGFFTASGPGSLVPVDGMTNSSKYVKILKSEVVPFLQDFADGKGTFQHDFATCHDSKAVKKLIKEKQNQQ
jgi:hypothetical protein